MKIIGREILIVEDEPIIAFVLEDLLRDRGATPRVAETLDTAFAAVSQTRFDLAILDVNVHGKKSYDLAKALLDSGTSVIFATGYGDALHPDELANVTTITKPYRLGELDKALAKVTSSWN